MGGQFPLTMLNARSDTTTTVTVARAGEPITSSCAKTNGTALGFAVLNPMPLCENRADSPTGWELKFEIAPNLDPVIAFFKGKKYGVFNTDAKKSLLKRKGISVSRSKGSPLGGLSDGLGLSAGREFYVTIGPVPIVVEVGASIGFSFKAEFEYKGESAKAELNGTPQQSSYYPCVNVSNSTCYSVNNTPLSFNDALTECKNKGGLLALALTASQLSGLNSAIGTSTSTYWIGAQTSYAYDYPACETNGGKFIDGGVGPNGTFSPACKSASATSYEWLRGGPIAYQRGLAPAILPGTNKNNAFANLTLPASPIPVKSGVTYQRVGSGYSVSSSPLDSRYPSICSYDGASEVKASSFSKKFNIEFNIGLNAALCVPSNRIGACISIDFQIFQALWGFGSSNLEVNVFRGVNTARYQQSLFGESENTGKWERKLLSGTLNFELRFYLYDQQFKIKEFALSKDLLFDGDIYPTSNTPYFRRFRE